jgi:hypothetical protein
MLQQFGVLFSLPTRGENYSRKLQGIKNICNIRYNGGSMQEYLDHSTNLLHSTIIAAGKDSVSLTELCMILVLNGLPNRFSITRSNLENDAENLQKPQVVRSKILEEDERQNLRNQVGGSALMLNPRCNHDRIKEKDCWHCHPELHPRNFTCTDCDMEGHKNKSSRFCKKSKSGGVANLTQNSSGAAKEDSLLNMIITNDTLLRRNRPSHT